MGKYAFCFVLPQKALTQWKVSTGYIENLNSYRKNRIKKKIEEILKAIRLVLRLMV